MANSGPHTFGAAGSRNRIAELNGKVYVIGGLTASGAGSAQVDVYDAASNSWQAGPALPAPQHHAAAVSAGGLIYSIGGFAGSSLSPVSSVFALDPATNTWSQRASLPTARSCPVSFFQVRSASPPFLRKSPEETSWFRS